MENDDAPSLILLALAGAGCLSVFVLGGLAYYIFLPQPPLPPVPVSSGGPRPQPAGVAPPPGRASPSPATPDPTRALEQQIRQEVRQQLAEAELSPAQRAAVEQALAEQERALAEARRALQEELPAGEEEELPPQVWPLDREGIAQGVQSLSDDMFDCYEAWLAVEPELEGRMDVQFTIGPDPDGELEDWTVTDYRLQNSELGHTLLEGCIGNAVEGLLFEPGEGGQMTVNYPFIFALE